MGQSRTRHSAHSRDFPKLLRCDCREVAPACGSGFEKVPGATLDSGGEGSPGTRSQGSAWPSCSAPDIWRQPKALLLCMFAFQAGGTPGAKTQKL